MPTDQSDQAPKNAILCWQGQRLLQQFQPRCLSDDYPVNPYYEYREEDIPAIVVPLLQKLDLSLSESGLILTANGKIFVQDKYSITIGPVQVSGESPVDAELKLGKLRESITATLKETLKAEPRVAKHMLLVPLIFPLKFPKRQRHWILVAVCFDRTQVLQAGYFDSAGIVSREALRSFIDQAFANLVGSFWFLFDPLGYQIEIFPCKQQASPHSCGVHLVKNILDAVKNVKFDDSKETEPLFETNERKEHINAAGKSFAKRQYENTPEAKPTTNETLTPRLIDITNHFNEYLSQISAAELEHFLEKAHTFIEYELALTAANIPGRKKSTPSIDRDFISRSRIAAEELTDWFVVHNEELTKRNILQEFFKIERGSLQWQTSDSVNGIKDGKDQCILMLRTLIESREPEQRQNSPRARRVFGMPVF